ncbi:MAG: NADH-quinone oxidoreductase subunit I [Acidobacteria bacterium]|nr:NADH-quinone oxidoreductase subunit I [Acidobacteriota bacterium]
MSFWSFLGVVIPIDLLQGLSVTGRFLFKKKATIRYPEVKRTPSPRFRGMFGFAEERCIVCHNCAKACPIKIIHIEEHFEELEIDGKKKKKKVLDRYDIDVKRCMFCGLCEEACPTTPVSIWLTTKTYETAAYERNERLYFTKERLRNWDGVVPFPGVVSPGNGMLPEEPGGAPEHKEGA